MYPLFRVWFSRSASDTSPNLKLRLDLCLSFVHRYVTLFLPTYVALARCFAGPKWPKKIREDFSPPPTFI